MLPRDQQPSYPDICLIDKPHSWVRLVKLKYAPDLQLHGHVREDALAQHAALRDALLSAGWGTVTIHPVIIGNVGTITAEVLNPFGALGINPPIRLKLGNRLLLLASSASLISNVRDWPCCRPTDCCPGGEQRSERCSDGVRRQTPLLPQEMSRRTGLRRLPRPTLPGTRHRIHRQGRPFLPPQSLPCSL